MITMLYDMITMFDAGTCLFLLVIHSYRILPLAMFNIACSISAAHWCNCSVTLYIKVGYPTKWRTQSWLWNPSTVQ